MVKCPRCGHENYSDNVYCENCMYPLKSQKGKKTPKRTHNDDGWHLSTVKKVIIVIGIIILAYFSFSIIYEVSQPSPENSLNVITTNNSDQYSSTRPYQVNISYNGSWDARIGQSNIYRDESGSGDDLIRLTCAGWDNVTVQIEKVDYSSKPLTVQLIKNGKIIQENTTTEPNGKVILEN